MKTSYFKRPFGALTRLVALGAFASLLSCGGPRAPEIVPAANLILAPPALGAMRAEFEEGVRSGRYPSIAVTVFDDGEVVWRETLGHGDRERGILATPGTVYAVGSLSKSVTATTILALVEQGLLDLEDPVEQHLGFELARNQPMRAATVKDLLHMTAGIPHGHFSPGAGEAVADRYVQRYAVQVFPARDHFLYSNYSYGLLSRIVENVAGKPFEAVVSERVFEPLGMTWARADSLGTGARDAVLYAAGGGVIAPYEWHPVAGGGMSASLLDLESYTRFHMGLHENSSAVLSEPMREMMQTTFAEIPSTLLALGIGSIESEGFGRLLLTSGSIAGGRSASAMLPELRDAAIVLINSQGDTDDVEFGAIRILEAMNPGFLESVLPKVEAQREIHYGKYDGRAPFLGSWCGTFEATTGDRLDARIAFAADGTAASSFRGAGPEASEPGMARNRVFSTLFVGAERVRFNLAPDGEQLIGSVVTTDGEADLTNDLPYIGAMVRCGGDSAD